MSDRRNRIRSKNRTMAYIAAGVVHALIIAVMVFNFASEPKVIDGAYAEKVDVVKAALVEDTQLQKRKKKIENDELEKKLQKKRDLERIEKKKLDDAKKKEKKAEDVKKKAEAEVEAEKKKAIALKKTQEDDKKKKKLADEAEKKKKKADAAKRKKTEDARKKKVAEEAERQRELNESIAAEEAFRADQRAKERATTLAAKYAALITEKVERFRSVAPGTERWRTTTVNVKLSSSGEVQSVRVVKSSGDERYDRSVETAIYQASPLPIPSAAEDPGVNKEFQDLNLNFDMSGL